jgi:hypothetical protein
MAAELRSIGLEIEEKMTEFITLVASTVTEAMPSGQASGNLALYVQHASMLCGQAANVTESLALYAEDFVSQIDERDLYFY